MVPLEEQGDDENATKKASKNNATSDRMKSPKKATSSKQSGRRGSTEVTRKESVHVKAGDPKHNWKMVREVVGFNETQDDKVVSSVSSDSFEVFDKKQAHDA